MLTLKASKSKTVKNDQLSISIRLSKIDQDKNIAQEIVYEDLKTILTEFSRLADDCQVGSLNLSIYYEKEEDHSDPYKTRTRNVEKGFISSCYIYFKINLDRDDFIDVIKRIFACENSFKSSIIISHNFVLSDTKRKETESLLRKELLEEAKKQAKELISSEDNIEELKIREISYHVETETYSRRYGAVSKELAVFSDEKVDNNVRCISHIFNIIKTESLIPESYLSDDIVVSFII